MTISGAVQAIRAEVESLVPPDETSSTYFLIDDERDADRGAYSTDRGFWFGDITRTETLDVGNPARAEYDIPMQLYLHGGAGNSLLDRTTRAADEARVVTRALENLAVLPSGVTAIFVDSVEQLQDEDIDISGILLQFNLRIHVVEGT
jgi:hypothetical protein